jgi:hypothetical protein
MALTSAHRIALTTVAEGTEARLDPHYYCLFTGVKEIVEGFSDAMPLTEPLIDSVRNGVNLPQAAYATDEEADYLYASVGSFSMFSFQPSRSQPLRSPDTFHYSVSLDQEALTSDEMVITRSGTPGIAWAVRSVPEAGFQIIPSGFLIRFRFGPIISDPVYIAAILNHPIWRVWSSALAGGKRQRNLSQEHLSAMRIPILSPGSQAQVASTYTNALLDVDQILGSNVSIQSLCDGTLRQLAGLNIKSLSRSRFSFDEVPLSACIATSNVRIDARFHRNDVRESLASIEEESSIELRRLMKMDVLKGRQPTFLEDGASGGGAVVATSSIQGGRVQEELLKLTSEEAVDGAGSRQVRDGDLLLAMDGEGSIGKATVYRRAQPAITDSHVAIIRLVDPLNADAIACFLNSSLGQAQIEVSISGSTGQTQLQRADVHRLRVPLRILDNAGPIGERYIGSLAAYEPITRQVRRRICQAQATITDYLLEASISKHARRRVKAIANEDALIEVMARLKPNMF